MDPTDSNHPNDGLAYRDNTRGQALAGMIGFFTAVNTILMVLRIWVIGLKRRRVYADDYYAFIAYACATALGGCAIWGVVNGLGGHADQLSAHQSIVQGKLTFSSEFTWTFGTCACKLAVLGLCARVFFVKKYRYTAYALQVACICYVLAFFPLFMSQCIPPSAQWNPEAGHCRPFEIEEYLSVGFNIALDAAVVILPCWPLYKLQMPLHRKLGFIALFSIGLGVIGVLCWRLDSTWRYATGRQKDGIYHLYNTALQSLLELYLGFIAATLPTLTPVPTYIFRPILDRFRSPWTDGYNKSRMTKI